MTDNFSTILQKRLQDALSPEELQIINESHLHAGHREAGQSIESHFRIVIKSKSLTQLNKVAQHRTIYKLCDEWMHNNPIHALAIEVLD